MNPTENKMISVTGGIGLIGLIGYGIGAVKLPFGIGEPESYEVLD